MMPFSFALLASAFVAWPQITIEKIKEPVPNFEWVGIPGAVQPPGWRRSKPVQDACPVYDDAGRVIGASIACFRGGNES